MGGKSDPPKAPDTTKLAEASAESAKIWSDVAREQLDWAKQTDAANRDILERVLGTQLPQLEEAFKNAQEDRKRYKDVFQPIEDNLVKEFQNYDTPERREQEAATRMADVRTSFEAQRTNAQRQLEDYGIDPSQTRYGALDMGYRAQEAAASAQAANAGRKAVEETGRALRGEAINIGRGYPGQVAQSQQIANQTGSAATGGAAGITNAGSGARSVGAPYAGASTAGYNSAANIYNTGYQNRMSEWNAGSAGDAGLWGGIGELAGGAMGMFNFGKKFAEGGEVPEDGATGIPSPDDNIPAMLAKDEYVIPADVVRRKGTEFFDKLLDKFKDGGEYEAQRQEAIPAGK